MLREAGVAQEKVARSLDDLRQKKWSVGPNAQET